MSRGFISECQFLSEEYVCLLTYILEFLKMGPGRRAYWRKLKFKINSNLIIDDECNNFFLSFNR